MRITLLTTSFPLKPESVSGVFVQRLVQSLPSWVSVSVLTPCASFPTQKSKYAQYKLSCFNYAFKKWQILAHQPGGIPVALKQHKALVLLMPLFLIAMFFACLKSAKNSDLIHANWSINGVIAGLAGTITQTPVLTTLRGEDVTRAGKSTLYKFLLKMCLVLNCKVIAVSEAIYAKLIKFSPKDIDKIIMIPNGVDENFIKISHTVKIFDDKNLDKLRIISVGSLIPRKGISYLIKATQILKEIGEFELIIIGTGVEREMLENLTETLGVSSHVQFLGDVPPCDIPEHLSKADIFILSSFSEGRPNVVLEALAAGIPTIATDIEGVTELVKSEITGMLFEPGNVNQLSEKIIHLWQNPELRRKLSYEGKKLILEQELVWSKVGKNYGEIYRKIIFDKKLKKCVD